MEQELEILKSEVESIKSRNVRVETEKKWETSNFRKFSIALITYIFMVGFFHLIKVENPFVNAIVPTFGFLLSTLSLSIFKSLWLKYIHERNN